MRNSRTPQLRRAAERRAIGGLDTLRDRRPITVASIGGQTSLTLDLDAEARGYAHSAVAYRCVAAIADNGSSVPLVVRTPDGRVIDGHPIAALFNKAPNPFMSARVFKSLMLQQLELGAQSFVWLDRGETGLGPVSAAHLVFDPVDVVVDKPLAQRPTTADIIGFIIRRLDGVQVPVLPEEMLWLRYPHPFDPLGCIAPWKAARHAVDMDAFAREWQRSSYANGGMPKGVVYLGQMDEGQFNAAKAAWRSSVQGPANAGKNLLVSSPPGGGTPISYARVGLTAEEMDYLESRMANSAEVMMAFGVPHDYLAAGTTYENRSSAKTTLWSDTICAKLEIIGSEIDLRLLPSDQEQAEFDLSEVDALREGADAIVTRTNTLVESDLLTLDEGRATVGYDPLPGGAGAVTLTAYRAQFEPVSQAFNRAADIDLARLVEQAASRAVTAVFEHLRPSPGARRLELTRADAPSSPSLTQVNAAYDELETQARRTVRTLADEQEMRVLRDFDRLMKKPQRSEQWLTELRTEACALARENAVRLAPPDLDVVPAACATELEVAAGPDGWEQRIGIRDLFDASYWRKRSADVLRPIVQRAWRKGGTTISSSFELSDPDVVKALGERVTELAGQVTATTEAVLRSEILTHGITEGASIPELRARIQRVFDDLSDFRATMIARTESVGGYNAAQHVAAVERGATFKTWLATDDTRTRATHRAASGSSVEIGKRFPLTDSRWPADPTAPANQSIQCRCTLTYQFEES